MNLSDKDLHREEELKEIMQHTDASRLHQFIADYAAGHPEFKKELLSRFGPQKTRESKDDYIQSIKRAFSSNVLKQGSWFRQRAHYGFDASGVSADLQPLLEKADFYREHGNYEAVILICCSLIETIPGEWDEAFDHDGDVQVLYEEAISKLREMLEQGELSATQVKTLFDWYSREHKLEKHSDVGMNTDLNALQGFFTGTPEMLQQTLRNMDERLEAAKDRFDQQRAALDKIQLLEKEGMKAEAEEAITKYLHFPDVRKLRVDELIRTRQYARAIDLLNEGIKFAEGSDRPGTANNWKERLLEIYLVQHDTASILATAEDLFLNGRDTKKYYGFLKEYTPGEEWPYTLERLLAGMNEGRLMSASGLKAEILIEHKMWDRLFDLCKKAGVEHLEHYEEYLKPIYAKEIFDAYYGYVEKQALLTEFHAYRNVARVLQKMKSFDNGEQVVNQLLLKYRGLYKRRKRMMEELKNV